MSNKEIILNITNQTVLFNPKMELAIEQTNIPKANLSFRSHTPIFWKVEMISFEDTTYTLKVRVLDYETPEISHFEKQIPKKEIKELLFENFNWQKLEPLLTFYQKSELEAILYNIDINPFSNYTIADKKIKSENKVSESSDFEMVEDLLSGITSLSNEEVIKKTFQISFSEITFKLGYIGFTRFIPELDMELNFKIINEYILPEFENIKYWFAKKLNSRKLSVSIIIKTRNGEVVDYSAHSNQADRINPALIEGVKYQRTFALDHLPRKKEVDQSLFTSEDIYNALDSDDIEGNIFNQSDADILKILLEKANIRNKKQLIYLSGKKQSEDQKLRYTLSPHFGFLFFIEGERNNHFVWELLNSHATYIWSIDKNRENVNLQYRRIEDSINTIRASGREQYKNSYKSHHHDKDLIFNIIKHHSINSELIDEFPRWRSRLSELLL